MNYIRVCESQIFPRRCTYEPVTQVLANSGENLGFIDSLLSDKIPPELLIVYLGMIVTYWSIAVVIRSIIKSINRG